MARKHKPPMTSTGKGARCAYCRRELQATTSGSKTAATRDHTYPASLGGQYRVWCCWACNMLKKDMMPSEWTVYMASNPKWWELAPDRTYRAVTRLAAMRGANESA